MDIAVVGGTGPQGRGLAVRFARAGHRVVIGSRAADRAGEKAAAIAERAGEGAQVRGAANDDAVGDVAVVVLAVPYEGHAELVRSLGSSLVGPVVVSCVNPLAFDASGPYAVEVPAGSAAQEAQALVPDARMVGAFHHVSAAKLWSAADLSEETVLVCGDDVEAKQIVIELAAALGGRPGVDAGPLRIAGQLEPLTAVLINVNKRYKVRSGVALTGLPD